MFLNCLYDSCSVKKEDHHLTRIMAEIVKRLKDCSDSGVRDACRDTIGALSRIYLKGNNSDALVGLFVKPLFEAMGEQNQEVQSGAAMCMSRMVESAATPPITSFQKLCPRICKLLSNPSFLAKASLLPVVSSLSQVGAIAPQSLESLLECIHDCLGSTNWVTQKAAADTLTALASHSSSLIKDKTDSTLAVLENSRFDKIKPVRESVTEALQLWKKISVKCVDGASDESNTSSGEQLGSEKSGEKRSDIADLMKKKASDGSTLSPDSATKGKEAVVMLKNKAPAFSEKEYLSAIQRQLLQLERQQTNLMNVVQEFTGGSHDRMVTLEGKVRGLERIFQDMARDLSISSGRRSNLTAGNRGSQLDEAMKGRMWNSDMADDWFICPHREGPSAASVWQSSKDEATLEAVRAAGEDESTRVAEAEAMGGEDRKGRADVNSMYAEVFGTKKQCLIIMAMAETGPVLGQMSNEIALKAIAFISQLMLESHHYYDMCFAWLQELAEELEEFGSRTFGVPMSLRKEVLHNLRLIYPSLNKLHRNVVPGLAKCLASCWDIII